VRSPRSIRAPRTGHSFLTRKIDDPMIEITLTVIAAYASFVSAESLPQRNPTIAAECWAAGNSCTS
jgi:hypothetical protein